MKSLWLTLLVIAVAVASASSLSENEKKLNAISDSEDIISDAKILSTKKNETESEGLTRDPSIPLASDPRFNKMLPKPIMDVEWNDKYDVVMDSKEIKDIKIVGYDSSYESNVEDILEDSDYQDSATYSEYDDDSDSNEEVYSFNYNEDVDMVVSQEEDDISFENSLRNNSLKTSTATPTTTVGIMAVDKVSSDILSKNDIAHAELGKSDSEYDYYEDEDSDEYYDNDNLTDIIDDSEAVHDFKVVSLAQLTSPKTTTTAAPPSTTDSDIADESYEDDDDAGDNYDDEEYDGNDDDGNEEDDEDDDDDDDDDDDSYDADILERANPFPNKIKNCPRDCICDRNIMDFNVATCNRLDPAIQNFTDAKITDLKIVDIGPLHPIVLGDEFFKKIGLSELATIKIYNCTIIYISPTAFVGLDNLIDVDLSLSGLVSIPQQTFATNMLLKKLKLSGNDLREMQNRISDYANFMLNSSSIEELELSNCNFEEILSTAFVHMKNLVYINLSENKLSGLPEDVFHYNTAIEELNLSINTINNLPRYIFNNTNLAILHLNNNEFSASPGFYAPDLQRLYFSYNKLELVDNIMFKDYVGLDTLDLHGNSITKIHSTAFVQLTELKNIDLSFNDLTTIRATIFLGNDKLDSVKLNDNSRLSKLPQEGFLSKTNLGKSIYHFDVSNCDLSEITGDTFATLPSLNTLNLAGNNLRVIYKDTFSYLTKLVDLDLSLNTIEFIDNAAFANNRNLRKLKLAYNRLESLPTKILRETRSLNELDISGNSLTNLWAESSQTSRVALDLKNLVFLNVSYNDITHVYLTDLEVMPGIRVLDIKHNPMVCDTSFQQLLKYVAKKHISSSDPNMGRPYLMTYFMTSNDYLSPDPQTRWDELAKQICVPMPNESIEDDDSKEIEAFIRTLGKPKIKIDSQDNKDESEESAESFENSNGKIREEDILISNEIDMVQSFGKRIFMGNDMPGRPYEHEARSHYMYPIVIILCTVIAVLLIIARVIAVLMHRRGERYREALIRSKNSIIYQKLTEDLPTPTQIPKLHKYMPVQQV